jgi:hypothetical protein
MFQDLLPWLAVVGLVGTLICGGVFIRTRSSLWFMPLCLGISCLAVAAITLVRDNWPAADTPARTFEPPQYATAEQKKFMVSLNTPPSTKLGALAPDFSLPRHNDGKVIHLHDLLGRKPVVLIFGSFGCDLFCSRIDGLSNLYDRFRDRAEFLFVYVTQAPHQMPKELQTAIDARARNADQSQVKHIIISEGLRYYHLPFACVEDNENGSVELAYGGFPQRLVIFESDGIVALDLDRGIGPGLELDKAVDWLSLHAQ